MLRNLDALIEVSSPWMDGAAAAGQWILDVLPRTAADRLVKLVVR